ncbi:UDP-GlcNAc:undecaprenyl-phosphate GlcNAc-1-phosphate transferase [Streptomyces sp. AmelKG-E11A]|nr:UDP-GlcNAc:undecaprenyl-phosphate GlcNAc-1-phosphate transferase [Streptomyces sp. AmelKG-E11A]
MGLSWPKTPVGKPVREYLLTLCITAAVTYLLTGPVRKFAIVAGAMPEIRARDVHREPTPRLGGIAMFFGLCAGLLVADHLTNLSEVFTSSNEPRALLSGAALIWLVGVLDDKFEIDALIKLGAQMIAAGVMVMQGLTILWLPVPGVGMVALTQWQSTLLTVALVVITINAVNFVDGLDGLAAGMVCIASVAFFLYAYRIWYGYGLEPAAPATLFAAILIGMCLGFLPHNMHPARIFMGDSGSMLIGLVLAAGAISITGQVDPDSLFTEGDVGLREVVHATVPVYIPLLLPLTIIAIPAADLVLAIVRRTWRGQSPFAADRGHLHHRLLDIGHSHSRSVLIMYFWAALISFGTLAYSVNAASMWIVLAVAALSAVGLVLLLLPRFTPRAPRWAESFVPPRYRRRKRPLDGQLPYGEGESDSLEESGTATDGPVPAGGALSRGAREGSAPGGHNGSGTFTGTGGARDTDGARDSGADNGSKISNSTGKPGSSSASSGSVRADGVNGSTASGLRSRLRDRGRAGSRR